MQSQTVQLASSKNCISQGLRKLESANLIGDLDDEVLRDQAEEDRDRQPNDDICENKYPRTYPRTVFDNTLRR